MKQEKSNWDCICEWFEIVGEYFQDMLKGICQWFETDGQCTESKKDDKKLKNILIEIAIFLTGIFIAKMLMN